MRWFAWFLSGSLAATVLVGVGLAQEAAAPLFNTAGELLLPTDYREWIFAGTGLGMTYGAKQRPADQDLVFDNVYVNRDAYRMFMSSGRWPERTVLVMEGRVSQRHQLLANMGTVQGDARYIEAAVKDSARFPETGWGYFVFGDANAPRATARVLQRTFDCYACHVENTAVENTFVQYYPVLFDVAKKLGTIKATFDPMKRF